MKSSRLLSALLAFGLGTLPAFAADKGSEPLATINGKPLTEKDYREAVEKLGPQAEMVKGNPSVREQFLDHLINSQLLADAAQKDKVDQSPKFKEAMEDARREILAKMYMDKYLETETSDAKLKDYFNKNKEKFGGKEVRASHILFKEDNKAEAEKVLKEALKKGADFDALAKKYSTGPSAPRGGDLGYFTRGRMVPEFEEAAFSLKKGQVYPKLVKTQFGYHIIKVTDVKDGSQVKFEDKKDEVARQARRDVQENLVKNLRDKSKVKVNEKALREMKL